MAAVMSFYHGTTGPDKGSHPNDVIAEVHALEMTMETMPLSSTNIRNI